MKSLKKIGISLIIVAVVLSLGVLAVLGAPDIFTGTIYRLGIYVDDMDKIVADVNENKSGSIEKLDAILIEIDTYLFEKPVNPEEEGYAELDAKIVAAKKLMVTKSLAMIAELEDPMDKSAYLKLADYWFENIPFTDEEFESDEYKANKSKIEETCITVATSLYNDINSDNFTSEVEKDIASEGVKLKRLRTFISDNSVGEDSDHYVAFVEMMNDFNDLWDTYQKMKDERYKELVKAAPLSEYGLGNGVSPYHFENNQKKPGLSNASKTTSSGFTRTVKVLTEEQPDPTQTDGINSYLTMRWPEEADIAINAYITPSYTGTSVGAVIEFDFTTFGDFVDNTLGFGNRRSDTEQKAMGGDTTAYLLKLDKNGNLLDSSNKIIFENFVVPGQWTRFSAVIDTKRPTETLIYVDYCYVATVDNRLNGSAPTNLRIGNASIKSGEFSMDNFTCQIGTWFRDDNLVNGLTDPADKLAFYVNYMLSDANRAPDRVVAYNSIKDLLVSYATYNEETGKYDILPAFATHETIPTCVEQFNNFDAEALINEYKQMNLEKLVTMKNELLALGSGLSTVTKRQAKVNEINTFITNNTGFIAEGADYNSVISVAETAQAEITMDTTINSFITTMGAFDTTTAPSLLTKKYNEATEQLGTIDLALLDKAGYEAFAEAYQKYLAAPDVIDDMVLSKNSRDIITYVKYLTELYPNEMDWKINPIEGDSLTEAEKAHNEKYRFIADYVVRIRKLVASGYSIAVNGIDAAIQRFDAMNAHFYDLLQIEYSAEFERALDEFAASDSYIVKKGLIAFLERYKEENDIDVTHPAIAPLETRFVAYKGELEDQVDSYSDILRQNSVYFVNYVRLFDTAITYTEKKALYDNATEYYYLMNASGDGVDEAIRIYDAMTAELAVVENASKAFVNALELRDLTDNIDLKYAYLVDAMINYSLVDASIEGIPAAIEKYQAELAEYNAEIGAANGEICEIGESLGSLRANCGLSAIISVIIEKLFSFAK